MNYGADVEENGFSALPVAEFTGYHSGIRDETKVLA
jgi:hypothetical protein